MKIKLLAATDAGVASGLGIIADNILSRLWLTGDYEIYVNAINYLPTDLPPNLPYHLMPAQIYKEHGAYQFGDVFGVTTLPMRIQKIRPDVLFLQNDLQVLRKYLSSDVVRQIPTVTYFPVDGRPIAPTFAYPLKDCLNITYTKFGQEVMQEVGIKADVIPPGINTLHYYPVHDDTREAIKKKYGLGGKFVVLRVDKFQPRKNWPATIKTFDLFAKQVPNAVLFTHCRWQDSGGDLYDVVSNYPSLDGKIFKTEVEGNADPFISAPVTFMNELYNMADVHLSTSLGEGYGMSTLEALATMTPAVGTNYAGTAELLGEGRGLLVDVAKLYPTSYGTEHAVIDEKSANIALLKAYRNGKKIKEMTEKGYLYAQSLDWSKIVKYWDEVFKSVVRK